MTALSASWPTKTWCFVHIFIAHQLKLCQEFLASWDLKQSIVSALVLKLSCGWKQLGHVQHPLLFPADPFSCHFLIYFFALIAAFTSAELLQTFLHISSLTLSSLTCRQSNPRSPLWVYFPFLPLYSPSCCPCCFLTDDKQKWSTVHGGDPVMESHHTNTHDRPLCAVPVCVFVCFVHA